jgi:hypothetical protein
MSAERSERLKFRTALNGKEGFAEALRTKLKEKEKNATFQARQSCSHFDQSLLSPFLFPND